MSQNGNGSPLLGSSSADPEYAELQAMRNLPRASGGEDPVVIDQDLLNLVENDEELLCSGFLDTGREEIVVAEGDDLDTSGHLECMLERELREEPSAIEKRFLNQTYNKGQWTSDEMRKLYDGIREAGTSDEAISEIYMKKQLNVTRTLEDVHEKVADLREMNMEHREERMRAEVRRWSNAAPPGVQKMAGRAWSRALMKLEGSRRMTKNNPLARNGIINALEQMRSESIEREYVTDKRRRRVSWPRIYKCILTALRTGSIGRDINGLESAIILSVFNNLEREVRTRMTDQRRGILLGLLSNIQEGDYRDLELRLPFTEEERVQPFLDPLMMSDWDRLEKEECVKEEIPSEDEEDNDETVDVDGVEEVEMAE